MKYCKHCGTWLLEGSTTCPNCKAPLKEKSEAEATNQKLSKKINRMMITIPLVVILTATVTFVVTYFLLPQRIADAMGSSDSNSVKTSVNSTEIRTDVVAVDTECAADEYGNHHWDSATCEEPAKCFDCGEYKNDLLGNHSWFPPNCVEPAKCIHCGTYKDDKLGNHSYITANDGQSKCVFCYAEKP